MATTTIKETEEILEERSYQLDYKSGQKVWHKYFKFRGNLADAISRGRRHCTVMGYWFVNVSPHIVDLDIQERDYMQAQNPDGKNG
jgi:hypothetical protein